MNTILLIDDEPAVLSSFAAFFEDCGYEVLQAASGRQGLETFHNCRPDLIFTDLRMPEVDGFTLLSTVKQESPETPVVVISGVGIISDAIRAVKLGAYDFVSKPVRNLAELEIIAKKALETKELRNEVVALRDRFLGGTLRHREPFRSMVTNDPGMTRIFQYIEAIAPSSQPILVSGQTGTGKELVAGAIHAASGRKGQFVALNLGGLDDQMFSDTLFGHLKGAFTGAERVREGMIVQASNGTLFLDEIGELTETSQVRLLRLLQEQEYFPLGSDTPRKCSARVVAATNRDLPVMVREGKFRQDLYYRLCTHHVQIPPLAARKGDLPLLLDHFLEEAAASLNKRKPAVPRELCSYLRTYDFPGNVRELKSMAFDALARHTHGPLSRESFILTMGDRSLPEPLPSDEMRDLFPASGDRFPTLKEAEDTLIARALQLADGNQGVAARYLGITRQGLNKILNRKKNS